MSSQEESVGRSGLKRGHGDIQEEEEDDDEEELPKVEPAKIKRPKRETAKEEEEEEDDEDDEDDEEEESGLPFVGRIDSFWRMKGGQDGPGTGQMKVKVRWFYHASEAGLENTLCVWSQRALFESLTHTDINDVQSIKKKCRLLPFTQFVDKMNQVRRKERTQPTSSGSPVKGTSVTGSPAKVSTGSTNPVLESKEELPDGGGEERRSSRRGAISLASGKKGRDWYYLAGTFEPLSRQVKYDPQVPLI